MSPIVMYRKDGSRNYEEFLNELGKRHNENGPAFISYHKNGSKRCESFFINGMQHNANGPAIIYYYENGNKSAEYFYQNEMQHNMKGPSVIEYNEDGEIETIMYYLHNKIIYVNSDEEFQKYVNRLNIS